MVYICVYIAVGMFFCGSALVEFTKDIDDDASSAAYAGLCAVVVGCIWPIVALLVIFISLGQLGRYLNQKLEK